MKTSSIAETKDRLSALIEQVRRGETVVITDHDRPVAKLVPVSAENRKEATDNWSLLERKGIIRRGEGGPCRLSPPPKTRKAGSAGGIAE